MSFCANCGRASGGGRFCGGCGAVVGETAPALAAHVPAGAPGSIPAGHVAGTTVSPTPTAHGVATGGFDTAGPGYVQQAATATSGAFPDGQRAVAIGDVVRDIGAIVVLIWTLSVPWSPEGTGGSLVYVLLAVLCSIASLLLRYLQRLMVRPDGGPLQWPTRGLRVAMNAPLAVVILATVIRNIAGAAGDNGLAALGPGVAAAAFGMALCAVPRLQELRHRADTQVITRRWRLGAGWAAGLGLASMVVTTVVWLAQLRGSGAGGPFALLIWVYAITLVFFVMMLAVPALRVGADHPAWQPVALWLGSSLVITLLALLGDAPTFGNAGALETVSGPFYGVWLLVLGAGLCATPLLGGRDGSQESVGFWALVVANAFRTMFVGYGVLAALFVPAIIQVQRYGSVSGTLIWALVATVVSALSAAVGSSQLRADFVKGRPAASASLAVVALVTLITLIVNGFSAATSSGAGGLVGIPVLIGTIVVIIFGMTAPKPIREAVAAHRPAPAISISTVETAVATGHVPTADPATFTAAPPGVAAWNEPAHASSADAAEGLTVRTAPHIVTAAAPRMDRPSFGPTISDVADATDDDDTERTVMRRRTSGAVAPTTPTPLAADDPQERAAADPGTALQDLMSIAQTRADLRATVAANPSTYHDLLAWLGQLGDPAVDAALARRTGGNR